MSEMISVREAIARIVLGKHSSFNYGDARSWTLEKWTQYPNVANALAKADAIITLLEAK